MPVREAITDGNHWTGRCFVFGQPGVSNHGLLAKEMDLNTKAGLLASCHRAPLRDCRQMASAVRRSAGLRQWAKKDRPLEKKVDGGSPWRPG
jgi:hypothetical protein